LSTLDALRLLTQAGDMQALATSSRNYGTQVIRQEADALLLLAETLGTAFEDAVARIVAAKGRIILTGMGKSGHIARKIAATLSATGSPSYYLHPAEASHGDLGLMCADDVLVALSNSGETAELMPVVSHARSLALPMIAITARGESLLGRTAAVSLCLPEVPEACPEQIAPTTSSTMMLALGDALAVAAMRVRGVSRRDLASWHPGGRIGWQLMPVDSVLRRSDPLPLVTPDACMRDVIIEMTSCGKGVAGVVDDSGGLIGVITDGDLRRSFDKMLTATAGEIMTADPVRVPSSTPIADAITLMQDHKITVLFVMAEDQRRPAGLVHVHDLGMAT
jgi:arabinose-5-phosphate isomerase